MSLLGLGSALTWEAGTQGSPEDPANRCTLPHQHAHLPFQTVVQLLCWLQLGSTSVALPGTTWVLCGLQTLVPYALQWSPLVVPLRSLGLTPSGPF
jgi:hypothetical protein